MIVVREKSHECISHAVAQKKKSARVKMKAFIVGANLSISLASVSTREKRKNNNDEVGITYFEVFKRTPYFS